MVHNNIRIKMFPAKSGDCFLIEFTKAGFRILIDGGFVDTYRRYLRQYLVNMGREGIHINLLIITHIDQDHINGIRALLEENGNAQMPDIIYIDEVWFNGFVHTGTLRGRQEVPYYEESVLQTMAGKNRLRDKDSGTNEISFAQGESIARLLARNGYNWNTSVGGNAICTNFSKKIKMGDIELQILNPTQQILNDLAKEWIGSLKSKCRQVVISENHLFDDAFEGFYINGNEDWSVVEKKISADDAACLYDWNLLAEQEDEKTDSKKVNWSSIAVLISYAGTKLLFPGDCPMSVFKGKLPDKIDIVKLPHHGSGKNMDKDFIRKTCVSYYLVSTDGRHTSHPSPKVIANILVNAPGKPEIIKNYDIAILNGIGRLEGESFDEC